MLFELGPLSISPDLIERFIVKYEPEPTTGCWLWTAAVNPMGYGVIGTGSDKSNALAHRLSWLIHKGPIPAGLFVCHHCDTPPCVNPAHLFVGTAQENATDCMAKGRHGNSSNHPKGESHYFARLSEADVLTIRADPLAKNRLDRGGPNRALAKRFGISENHIHAIRARKTWKHI